MAVYAASDLFRHMNESIGNCKALERVTSQVFELCELARMSFGVEY